MASIGLSMIVKDEAHVIERALRSVRPIVDYVIVTDTGSSDGTQDIVRAYLEQSGQPGEVIDMPWSDFATNRTAALLAMRSRPDIDYCLMIDADEQLVYDDWFDAAAFKRALHADWLNVRTRMGELDYLRPQLVRNALDFRYRGALHEFLEVPPGEFTSATIHGFVNRPTPDGARSRNPRKFDDDAALLRRQLEIETDPMLRVRYQFYLAQSLRDAGNRDRAIEEYRIRSRMGGWQEEVFVSLYEIAKLREQRGDEPETVIDAYLIAFEANRSRAEPLVACARYARLRDRFGLAYLLARRALELTQPADALFAEPLAYHFQAKDEAGVAAYWLGLYDECLRWCDELLQGNTVPSSDRDRVIRNRAFAMEKIAEVTG